MDLTNNKGNITYKIKGKLQKIIKIRHTYTI